MQKKILPPSSIADSIDRDQRYDKKTKIPTISCLSCLDIICLQCLNAKCQTYKAKKLFNKCNKCPQEMAQNKFKKCLPILNFLDIYDKIRQKQNYYRKSCQQLQSKLNELQNLTKHNKKQAFLQNQLQRMNVVIQNKLKQIINLNDNILIYQKKVGSYQKKINQLCMQNQRLNKQLSIYMNKTQSFQKQSQRLDKIIKEKLPQKQKKIFQLQEKIKFLKNQSQKQKQSFLEQMNYANRLNSQNWKLRENNLKSRILQLQSIIKTHKIDIGKRQVKVKTQKSNQFDQKQPQMKQKKISLRAQTGKNPQKYKQFDKEKDITKILSNRLGIRIKEIEKEQPNQNLF